MLTLKRCASTVAPVDHADRAFGQAFRRKGCDQTFFEKVCDQAFFKKSLLLIEFYKVTYLKDS